MNTSVIHNLLKTTDEVLPKTVVRLTTKGYVTKDGRIIYQKELRPLRRQCAGFQILDEDIAQIGVEGVVGSIMNLDACKDGLYKVCVCNESTDLETGYVDDYELELIPFEK